MEPLTVRDAMTGSVFAVAMDTSLETAARLLASHHFSGAPVVNRKGQVVGVVTLADLSDPDRDRTTAEGRAHYYRIDGRGTEELGDDLPTGEGVVKDVMSHYVLAISPDAPLLDAVRLMSHDHVHRLLVVEDGKLVGIVTTMDVLKVITRWAEAGRDGWRPKGRDVG